MPNASSLPLASAAALGYRQLAAPGLTPLLLLHVGAAGQGECLWRWALRLCYCSQVLGSEVWEQVWEPSPGQPSQVLHLRPLLRLQQKLVSTGDVRGGGPLGLGILRALEFACSAWSIHTLCCFGMSLLLSLSLAQR